MKNFGEIQLIIVSFTEFQGKWVLFCSFLDFFGLAKCDSPYFTFCEKCAIINAERVRTRMFYVIIGLILAILLAPRFIWGIYVRK